MIVSARRMSAMQTATAAKGTESKVNASRTDASSRAVRAPTIKIALTEMNVRSPAASRVNARSTF